MLTHILCGLCCFTFYGATAQLISQGYTTNYGGGRVTGGTYSTEVGTSLVGGPTADASEGIYLGLAAFNLESGVIITNAVFGENTVTDNITGTLLRVEQSGNYDTVDVVTNGGGAFSFDPVFLGQYLVNVDSDPEKYVATYFGDAFLWDEAQILDLAGDSSISIQLVGAPSEDPVAEGVVSGTIEEDFGEEENARVDARRRAKKRKCGLRRRRTGGRPSQEDGEFELIAYGETNENGEFEYGFLPQGTYRFFVEYPGIPLDESSFVQFDIGASGVSDDTFVLSIFATEEGVSVELVLGITSEFFQELNVYPNPTSDLINISYEEILTDHMKIEILDLNGGLLFNQQVNKRDQQVLKVDIANYPSGIYLIKFTDQDRPNNAQLVYRFIKQ